MYYHLFSSSFIHTHQNEIGLLTTQLRNIERRILRGVRERNSRSLAATGLPTLLDSTYRTIFAHLEDLTAARAVIARYMHAHSVVVRPAAKPYIPYTQGPGYFSAKNIAYAHEKCEEGHKEEEEGIIRKNLLPSLEEDRRRFHSTRRHAHARRITNLSPDFTYFFVSFCCFCNLFARAAVSLFPRFG